jgi:predicted metal-binding protein
MAETPPPLRNPVLQVCLQCGSTVRDTEGCKIPNPAALALANQLQKPAQTLGVRVQLVRCFGHCTAPIAWGVRAENGWGYTFAPAPENLQEILSFVKTWVGADHLGLVPKKAMPESIKTTMKSRLPSPDYDPHL